MIIRDLASIKMLNTRGYSFNDFEKRVPCIRFEFFILFFLFY